MCLNLEKIEFSENSFLDLTEQVKHECLMLGSDMCKHAVCYPITLPKQSRLNLKFDWQKRHLGLIFTNQDALETIFLLSMSPYIRLIREYRQICNAYQEALMQSHASAIETIDMARRGIHNQAAELIADRTKEKLVTNHEACRNLFSIMTLLVHIK